jgi:hypothetical protein
MNRKSSSPIPERIVQLQRQLDQFRIAQLGLKKRLGGVPSRRRKAPRPAFVELVAPHPATLEDCILEFETTESLWIVIENGSL